ncbi:hypothetical protein CK203_036597 [Vitis vinifera]|uniref:Uncharacterized protein n=1 Tax=Vitis vinifera TaxID=29760 RepID=A0A438HII7_VITVI|nr:hypothetical protein CK203_036597 [Vitis vinifera]
MSSKKKIVSSTRVGDAREKATNKLDVKEFRDRFCIPNGVIVELLNDEEVFVPTEKAQKDTIIFSKEQFNAGLRFPLPVLFKEFLHFTQIPPAFIHPNIVRHVRSPALPSIGDGAAGLDEGRCEGTRGGPGCMGGVEASGEALLSKLLLSDSGSGKEGHITQGEALQDAAFCAESNGGRPGVPGLFVNILPRKLPNEVVPGEHYTVKDLPIYQEFKEADAEKHRALLDDREKRKNEGTLRKAPGQKRGAASPPKKAPAKKRKLVKNGKGVKEPTPPKEFALPPITHEAEVIIEEPVNPAPHSISSGPGHVAGLNHSSTSLAAVARLANLAEEAASINHPGSPNPDVDAVKPFVRPHGGSRAESQSQPSDDPDRLALVLVKGPPSKRPFGAQSEVRTHRAASRSSARD